MASTDKLLGRFSVCATLIAVAGVVVLPFLPGRDGRRVEAMPMLRKPAVDVRLSSEAPTEPPAVKVLPPLVSAPQVSAPEAPVPHVSAPQVSAPHDSAPTAPDGAALPPPEPDVWTDAQQVAELRKCLRLLAPIAAQIEIEEPMKKGACGTPVPIRLRSIGTTDKVVLPSSPNMNCQLAAGLVRWVDTVLQPAAREVLGSRITRIVGAAAYSCRNVYHDPKGPLSEHATGNAIDISGFVTADGRTISVKKGWGPTERDIIAAEKKRQEQEERAKAAKAKAKAKKDGAAETVATDPAPEDGVSKTAPEGKGSSVHKAGFTTEAVKRSPTTDASPALSPAKTVEAAFLRRLHEGACGVFGTALGPEANEAHRDHFHFDMKARRSHSVCH
jgi:hypothetical protein